MASAADVKPFHYQDVLELESKVDTPWKKLTGIFSSSITYAICYCAKSSNPVLCKMCSGVEFHLFSQTLVFIQGFTSEIKNMNKRITAGVLIVVIGCNITD